MNKARRKMIDEALEKLGELHTMIETIRDEEQEAYDNMPEGLQESERGEAMYDAIDALESAMDSCDEIEEYLQTAQE